MTSFEEQLTRFQSEKRWTGKGQLAVALHIRKCKQNIDMGLHAVMVTIAESRAGIESLAKHADIENRICCVPVGGATAS
jgi:hypothetical protein